VKMDSRRLFSVASWGFLVAAGLFALTMPRLFKNWGGGLVMTATSLVMVTLRSFLDPSSMSLGWRPRSDAGTWHGAPVAEVDKTTTCGRLLASRARREPGLRVVESRGGPPTDEATPGPFGSVWDRELDG